MPDWPVREILASLPTPLHRLPGCARHLNVDLMFKRDDLTGFGLGGNKVRKLEYILGDAVQRKATTLIAMGGYQSNLARVVAFAARKLGLEVVLVLRGSPGDVPVGNHLLCHVLGARIDGFPAGSSDEELEQHMTHVADRVRAEGGVPYVLPLGGASGLGALGYVAAAHELAQQIAEARERKPDYIVVATGSGGTQAGLICGARAHLPTTPVIGVSVGRNRAYFETKICSLLADVSQLIGQPNGEHRGWAEHVWVEDGYVGAGYGYPSDASLDALELTARADGILLDPVYTGKAFAAVIALCEKGVIEPGSLVVFWHTGGHPCLFAHAAELYR